MIPGLEPIGLRELSALDAPKRWDVDGYHDQLQSLTPIRGMVEAEHRGNVLAVAGSLRTIVTLCCDRCLNQFNHQLSAEPNELIWLGDAQPTDQDLQGSEHLDPQNGLVEWLDPRGPFDPQQWAFEQLNLQLPVVNHCGKDCPGPATLQSTEPKPVDPRWKALIQLQRSDREKG